MFHSSSARWRAPRAGIACAMLLAGVAAGCGTPSAPQPPTLGLPQRVTDLHAERTGETVELHWTMPLRTTDKVLLKGPVLVHICRRSGSGPCDALDDRPYAPGAQATFQETLHPALTAGAGALLTYTLELRNHAGKTAGPSNECWVAAGAAPFPLEHLRAEVRREGVVLTWDPAPDGGAVASAVRVERSPAEAKAQPEKAGQRLGAAPLEQASGNGPATLLVHGGATSGGPERALDRSAAFGQSYRYAAERVQEVTLGGHALTVSGKGGGPVTVDVRDRFPPAVPGGLITAADRDAQAIDLSWTPDMESDLAGYSVYRRDAGKAGSPVRISPAEERLGQPSFRDVTARPGQRYAYSVTATDRDGNESPRSAEVEDGLP